MCGTQHAGGHVAEFVRHGLFTCPDCAGTLARNVAERAAERTQASPTRLKGDLGDGQVGLAKQRRRALDPPREQVPVRRDTEGLLERSCEMSLGHAAHARQPIDGPLFMRSGVHPILCAQQAAQQLRVLACGNQVCAHHDSLEGRASTSKDQAERGCVVK